MPSLQKVPSQPPFLPPIWTPQKIERFDPIGLERSLRDDPGEPTVEAGVADARGLLRAGGLVVGAPGREPLPIVGGIGVTADSPIVGYDEGFMISRGKDGSFLAQVAGRPGHRLERHQKATLGEAVDIILAIYRQRGSLAVPR